MQDLRSEVLKLKQEGRTIPEITLELQQRGFKSMSGKKLAEHHVAYMTAQGGKVKEPAKTASVASYQRVDALPVQPFEERPCGYRWTSR